MNQDEQHLQLLSIFHYVCAGMVALFSCIPIVHLTLLVLVRPSVKALFDAHAQPAVAA